MWTCTNLRLRMVCLMMARLTWYSRWQNYNNTASQQIKNSDILCWMYMFL